MLGFSWKNLCFRLNLRDVVVVDPNKFMFVFWYFYLCFSFLKCSILVKKRRKKPSKLGQRFSKKPPVLLTAIELSPGFEGYTYCQLFIYKTKAQQPQSVKTEANSKHSRVASPNTQSFFYYYDNEANATWCKCAVPQNIIFTATLLPCQFQKHRQNDQSYTSFK